MSAEWPLRSLKDVADLLTGFPFKSKDYSNDENGYKLLRGDNIVQGCFRWEDVKRWPKSLLIDKDVKYFLKEGDVILAMDRPWIEAGLKFAQISSIDMPCLLVQRVACLRANETLDQDFLRYLISSYSFVEYVKQVQTGTAVPHISGKQILNFEFNLPPKIVQKSTSKILKSLDNKIQLNNQINQTLEQMAQAIFKSWFIDFEPTRAKIIAKEQGANLATQELAAQAIICGAFTLEQLAEVEQNLETTLQQAIDEKLNQHKQTNPTALNAQQLKTTAALFPNELVESELGDVPEGWAISSVGEHVKVTKGRSYKSVELEESDTALVTLKSFMRGGGYREDGLKAYTGAYKPEQVVEPGELVMSLTDVTQAAEIIGKPAIVTKNNDFKTLVASLDVSILRPKKKEMKEYFYGLMSTYRFHRYAESFATGTTVLHLNTKGITSFEFALPDFELCRVFSKMVLPMLAVQQSNIHLSRTLEELRDSLLPKLLSGELDVSALADNSQSGA